MYFYIVKGQKLQGKWQAWMLIMVFVPMMMLSFFHVHASEANIATECHECLHHIHHSHFGSADQCIDQCVLCQFLSLTFISLTSAIILFAPIASKHNNIIAAIAATDNTSCRISGRAPPM